MNYNIKQHHDLLKLSKKLQDEGKSLFRQNRIKHIELIKYSAIIENEIIWRKRRLLKVYIENFLNGTIDGQELCEQIYNIRRKLIKISDRVNFLVSQDRIKNININKESQKIRGFLTESFCLCDSFDDNYKSEEFYNLIYNGFLNLEKILDENI